MHIDRMTAVHVRIPLETPYVFFRGAMTAFDSVIVRVQTDSGISGFGEAAPLPPAGDAALLATLLNGPIAGVVLGADPFNIEALLTQAFEAAGSNLDALAGIDLALWDIVGKALGQPAHRLIGGVCQDRVAVDYTLSASSPSAMAEKARAVHREGFRGVVIKVTGQSVEEDVQRTRAVRDSIPADCSVRVDCNAAYTRAQALEYLWRIADFEIEFVEQPVAAGDLEGMRKCRAAGIPIAADESLVSFQDALALIREQACDIMNIKVPKQGGLMMAKRFSAIASAAGMPVVVGGRTTLDLSRYASRHFAASTWGTMGRAHEGPGPASQSLSDDVVTRRTTRRMVGEGHGALPVETAPGLGYEVDWTKVEKYAVRA